MPTTSRLRSRYTQRTTSNQSVEVGRVVGDSLYGTRCRSRASGRWIPGFLSASPARAIVDAPADVGKPFHRRGWHVARLSGRTVTIGRCPSHERSGTRASPQAAPCFSPLSTRARCQAPTASAGRSVAARGGRPTAWMPAELRPDVGCWRPLWTAGGLVVVWSSAHVSIASSTSRTRCYRGSLRRRMSKKDCQAVRREMAPSGAKGLNGSLRVSMYQIASVSLRASSICATFAPRWRPRRRLVRW